MLAGTILWSGLGILGVVGPASVDLALTYFWATGLIFPLAIVLGKLMGHEPVTRSNPLAMLGAYLSGLQMLFFPVLLWGYWTEPSSVPWLLGVLTGAHFLPFAWLYDSRAYLVCAIAATAAATVSGFVLPGLTFIVTPFAMAGVFTLSAALLLAELRADQRREVG